MASVTKAAWIAWASTWLGEPLLVFLRHPVVVAPLVLIALVLVTGAGRSFGVPLLFWNEDANVQRLAGFATTALVAYVVFSIALAEATAPAETAPLVAATAVLWAGIVAAGAWVRASALASRARGAPRTRWALVAALPSVAGGELTSQDGHEVSPVPFVQGALAAAALGFAAWCADSRVGPWADAALRGAVAFAPCSLRDPHLHVLAFVLVALQIALLATLGHLSTPPAVGVCVLVSLVVAADGALTFWLGSPGAVAIVGGAFLAAAGRERYAIRVPELEAQYPGRRSPSAVPIPAASREGATAPAPAQLADALVSPAPLASGWPDDGESAVRPLILVCTSGGGARAALWTALVLEKLQERIPRFAARTLMLTGASGGMVGAAAWVRLLDRHGARAAGHDAATAMEVDGLSPVARAMVFHDVAQTFRAAPNRRDRGRVLQTAWTKALEREWGVDLDVPLSTLATRERQREIPSLVFSPTVVEDGSRVFISNLSLDALTDARAPWLATSPGGPPGRTTASTTSRHLRALVGPGAADRITLATAARISASFPIVGPAVVLPGTPRRRLVDAGYFDNFGVDIATLWLREALVHQKAWLYDHVSRIVVIQIRDSHLYAEEPGHASRAAAHDETPSARLGRAIEGLTSPLECLANARNTTMRSRNDAHLDTVGQLYACAFGADYLTTTVFELRSHVSLSWSLSSYERAAIRKQAGSRKIDLKAQDVARWLSRNP